jgi:hypothetical protein
MEAPMGLHKTVCCYTYIRASVHEYIRLSVLRAFAKCRNAAISFVIFVSVSPSIRPSVRMEQLAYHWKDFYEILYLSIFRQSCEKIQVSLKSDKNNEDLHEDVSTFMITSRCILLRMRNISDKIIEKIKTHILRSIILFQKPCCLYNNVEKHPRTGEGTHDNILWRTHFTCWINKGTNTHNQNIW